MGKGTAFNAPLITFPGRAAPGNNQSANPDAAPSVFYGSVAMMDSRGVYNNGRSGTLGWMSPGPIEVLNAVPSATSGSSLAASQVAVAGTPLTLVGVSGGGITVLTSATAVTATQPSGNAIPVGARVIDGLSSQYAVGLDGYIQLWNTGTLIQRAVQITSAGNDSGGYFTVVGCDYGGYPVTQRLAGANAGVATTTKTFAAVFSITPGGTVSGSTVTAGHADVFGFPIAASLFERVDIYWNGALITSSIGFVPADLTNPATNLTGDPRGTYAVPTASNSAKRLVVYVTPSAAALAGNNLQTGVWGVRSV